MSPPTDPPTEMSDEDALAVLTQLIKLEADGAVVALAFGPATLFHLVSALQLALRHPDLGEHLAEQLLLLSSSLQGWFRTSPVPAAYDVLERGWDGIERTSVAEQAAAWLRDGGEITGEES